MNAFVYLSDLGRQIDLSDYDVSKVFAEYRGATVVQPYFISGHSLVR